jgi:hypothetical protein
MLKYILVNRAYNCQMANNWIQVSWMLHGLVSLTSFSDARMQTTSNQVKELPAKLLLLDLALKYSQRKILAKMLITNMHFSMFLYLCG